jgi:transposase InsO family protein
MGIEHRFTKINHPWTNGQVERMNRTIKDATVKRYHYDDHDQFRRHLADFVAAKFAEEFHCRRHIVLFPVNLLQGKLGSSSSHP